MLVTLNSNSNKVSNPIISLEKRDDGFYYILEVASKEDVENLIRMDNVDWRGYRVRIQKPWRFFTDYNDTEGNNVRKIANKKSSSSLFETDNKLFIGGIPVTAKEKEVKEILESFGMLKTFNLVRDPNDENLNRGFAFFEYANENDTEKALKVILLNQYFNYLGFKYHRNGRKKI